MCEANEFEIIKTQMEKTRNLFIPLFKALIRLKNTEKRCLLQGIVINGDYLIAKGQQLCSQLVFVILRNAGYFNVLWLNNSDVLFGYKAA